ncbi:MAG: glycosyltransferase, partial [Chloroflexota bacterium]
MGLLWGDFPWEERARRVGNLLSMGAVGRVTSHALRQAGHLVPYRRPPPDAPPETRQAALATFLQGIDVLWADMYPGTEPALRLRQELGLRCPVVLFAAGTMSKGADTLLFHWQPLLRPGDGLWFSSEADRAIWRRVVRRSALHEWVVPLGVDETLFRPRAPAERRAVREAHGLPPTAPLLLSVGRLNIQKNLHTLLRLLAAVRREVADAHLCFVGEEDGIGLHEFGVLNTGYVAWLRGQAAELGLADAVTFTGPLFGEDLAALYAAADVVVSASVNQRENGGLAQAEAQACGVPVVCSAWGGFKDVVRDGETGFLMEAVLIRHGIRVDWATGAA